MNDPGVTDGGPAGLRLLAYGSHDGALAAACAAAVPEAALSGAAPAAACRAADTTAGALAGAAHPARVTLASPADSAAPARMAPGRGPGRRGVRTGRAARLTGTPRAGGSVPRRYRRPAPGSR